MSYATFIDTFKKKIDLGVSLSNMDPFEIPDPHHHHQNHHHHHHHHQSQPNLHRQPSRRNRSKSPPKVLRVMKMSKKEGFVLLVWFGFCGRCILRLSDGSSLIWDLTASPSGVERLKPFFQAVGAPECLG